MRLLAYIDLPSGSAIFQFLIAGLLGVSVAFRSVWRKVWDALTGRGRRERSTTPSPGSGRAAEGGADDPGASDRVDAGTDAAGSGAAATPDPRSELPARKG